MSLVKGKQEWNTILDVSRRPRVSKNYVVNALRKADVLELQPAGSSLNMVENDIRIGMYRIKLCFADMDSSRPRQRLRQYGGFKVTIFEGKEGDEQSYKYIPIHSDRRFHGQYWLSSVSKYNVRMKTLVDIVMHCARLNKLKAFN